MIIKKTVLLITFFVLLLSFTNSYAGNPFLSGSSEKKSVSQILPHPFVQQLKDLQRDLHQTLSSKIKEVKETNSLSAIFSLIMIAFLYGVIHSAGPGHNKAVVATYLLARGRKLSEGIFVGSVVAFLHGASGVISILILHYVLRVALISSSIDDVSRITQIVSFSIIILVGFISLLIKLNALYRRTGSKRTTDTYISRRGDNGPLFMGLIMGLIPCPGVVLLMLFALSMNMIGLGIFLSFALTIGMVVTISIIGFLVLLCKNFLLDAINWGKSLTEFLEYIVEIISSILITIIGILMLIAVV
ncbi:MAG: hypothetical protein GY714_21965 [Desulfobacterales bacterium]|nr:hypothetical protein [Desulfobacterales bacterium]MCP4158806.1 hypothetical protein [Deltaproteobacteria bacterium]